ncbi:hypothetical protein STAWA0001_0347 [Staphylococcus warneri L37603]|nr:hypothetical protein STAWA0001_0347 [Staphylococcus warneri L37603]
MLAVADAEHRARAHRRAQLAHVVDHAEAGLEHLGGEVHAEVAAQVVVELDVRVPRERLRGGVRAVAARGDRRGDELDAHGLRGEVVEVLLDVRGEGLVDVAGEHHRVADARRGPRADHAVARGDVAVPRVHVAPQERGRRCGRTARTAPAA